MTNKIDPIKLKAAAEHLEWVCQQYPNEEKVRHLFEALQVTIRRAKSGEIQEPIADRADMPYRWAMTVEGLFRDYTDPDIEGAYLNFGIELSGGLSDQEKRLLEEMEAQRAAILRGGE